MHYSFTSIIKRRSTTWHFATNYVLVCVCTTYLCCEFVNRRSCPLLNAIFFAVLSKRWQDFSFSAYILKKVLFLKTAELHSVVTVHNHFSDLFWIHVMDVLYIYQISINDPKFILETCYDASTQNNFLTLNILNVCYTLHWAIKFDLLCPLKGL